MITVDIIICIHNALDNVVNCLSSMVENTKKKYNLILINDASNFETTK